MIFKIGEFAILKEIFEKILELLILQKESFFLNKKFLIYKI